MGTNRRYGSDIRSEAIARFMAGQPQSLSELEAGSEVTVAPEPIPVTAWVRMGGDAVLVEAHAVAWTAKAACVVGAHDGAALRVWVWASAVTRRS